MTYFLLNLFFAGGWMLVNGAYGTLDFLVGFGVGFSSLWLSRPLGRDTGYFRRLKAALHLFVWFMWEMLISAFRVAGAVLTPAPPGEPDILRVPLSVTSDLEITILAHMVSLTPGTLSLDVSSDRKYLVIHAMFAPSREAVIDAVKEGMEKKLLEVMRG